MDNGEKEKAVANGIKDIVKHTSRRKGTGQTQIPRNREAIIRIAPRLPNDSVATAAVPVASVQQATPPSDHGSSSEDGAQGTQAASSVSIFSQCEH